MRKGRREGWREGYGGKEAREGREGGRGRFRGRIILKEVGGGGRTGSWYGVGVGWGFLLVSNRRSEAGRREKIMDD